MFLASTGISASEIDLDELFVLGFNCRLVFTGIFGGSLVVALPCSVVRLISYTCPHFPPKARVAMGEFLVRLQVVLLVFYMGIAR